MPSKGQKEYSLAFQINLNMQQARINSAQYELLNVLSCINKEEDLAELKSVIVKFLNTRLQKEVDRLWENGTLCVIRPIPVHFPGALQSPSEA